MTARILIGLLAGSATAITGALYISGELHHWAHQYRRWRKERGRKGLVGG